LELLVDKLILLRHISAMRGKHAGHKRHRHAERHRHWSRHEMMVGVLELGRAVAAHSKTERRLISQEHLVEVTPHLEMCRGTENWVSQNRNEQMDIRFMQLKAETKRTSGPRVTRVNPQRFNLRVNDVNLVALKNLGRTLAAFETTTNG